MCDRYCLQEKFEAFLKELERERQLKIEEVMVTVCRTWYVYCNGVILQWRVYTDVLIWRALYHHSYPSCTVPCVYIVPPYPLLAISLSCSEHSWRSWNNGTIRPVKLSHTQQPSFLHSSPVSSISSVLLHCSPVSSISSVLLHCSPVSSICSVLYTPLLSCLLHQFCATPLLSCLLHLFCATPLLSCLLHLFCATPLLSCLLHLFCATPLHCL